MLTTAGTSWLPHPNKRPHPDSTVVLCAIAGFGAFGLPNRNVEPWTITVGKDIGKGSVAFTPPVVIVHAWM
jgi:hypothetical protein